jgi:hypothetical protein
MISQDCTSDTRPPRVAVVVSEGDYRSRTSTTPTMSRRFPHRTLRCRRFSPSTASFYPPRRSRSPSSRATSLHKSAASLAAGWLPAIFWVTRSSRTKEPS